MGLLDGDPRPLDGDRLAWPAIAITPLLDFADRFHTVDHPAEDRVLAVEPRRACESNEEPAALRVRLPGVCHGENASPVVPDRGVGDGRQGVAGSALRVPPALGHEARDDPVEVEAVKISELGEVHEAGGVLWRHIGKEEEGDRPEAGFQVPQVVPPAGEREFGVGR